MPLNKLVHFTVNGMHCGGCANKIKSGLATSKIEHSIEIDVEKKSVKIHFNSDQGSIATLKDRITEAGFQVEKIELE